MTILIVLVGNFRVSSVATSGVIYNCAARWRSAGFDGTRVQGWLVRQPGFAVDRKYPLILTIHGGPHGMFGYSSNFADQVEASHGYPVLYINPRGSASYGQAFSDGCINDGGGGDYKDLMAGLD